MNTHDLPVVTVVIPCFNQGHYLGVALESIMAQTYPYWEAIVVNDGSTDDTAAVAAGFTDPRICCVYQENQRLSAARNTGIRAAQGRYLAFLDADDEWEPQFLQRCLEVLANDETLAGVYTLSYFVDQQGNVLPKLGGYIVPPREFRARNLEGGFLPQHAALIRASVFREVGLFDTELSSEEDWDLWLRIAERHQLQGIPEPLVRYRVYPGSMSTNALRMHENRIKVLTKYFGPPEGDSKTWSREKRQAYGFAFCATAYGYIAQRQPNEGWNELAHAASIWPGILERLDTFYELACGDQARGYRGQAKLLDVKANGAEMLRGLDLLFATASASVVALEGAAYGNAYLALGMLSDQAGEWRAAQRYLWQAARHNPRLLLAGSFLRRLLKLTLGSSAVRWIKSVRARANTRHIGAIAE